MMTENIRLKLKLIFVPGQENNYRPKFLESRVLIWCLLALFILKLITVPFLIYFPKSALFSDISKIILIELLNKDRQSAGLQSLKENTVLDNAAVLKAQDILEKDYFSHQSPEGVSPWHWFKIAGYNYKIAGENLAIGFLDSGEVNQAWLDSPSHKANLLNSNYKDVGIAILKGDFQGNETTVVVQLFGTPQQTITGPKVQTKEQVKEEVKKETATPTAENAEVEEDSFFSTSSEASVKEATGTQTLSAEFASMTKQVAPALVKEDKSSSSATELSPRESESGKEARLFDFTAARVKEAQEKATFNFLSFLTLNYSKVIQIIIYSLLALIILALIINIFVRIDIQHVDLILKTLGFIAVLVLFILVDQGVIIKLIPHNFYIY